MIKMNEDEKTLLKAQLIVNYYKKDITDRYVKCIENIVFDNDVLNIVNEKVFVTTFDKYMKLQNNWNELKKWLEEVIDYEEYDKIEKDTFEKVLNKMQELEGNNGY